MAMEPAGTAVSVLHRRCPPSPREILIVTEPYPIGGWHNGRQHPCHG